MEGLDNKHCDVRLRQKNMAALLVSIRSHGHRTSHEPLLPQQYQPVVPQLLGSLLVHEQLQDSAEETRY